MSAQIRPTRLVVDADAIAQNVGVLAAAARGAGVCAVVKADGYGHGSVTAARAALGAGASWLAVALVEEGEELRAAGIDAPILVMTEPPVAGIGRLLAARLTPTVYSPLFIDALERAAASTVEVHVKADTGMARAGVPEPAWADVLDSLGASSDLSVSGLWTHLACADEPNHPSVAQQLARFEAFLALARTRGMSGIVHAANTAATLAVGAARFDMVRVGIGIYGLSPSPSITAASAGLRQALRLVSEVALAKRVAAGSPASYGHLWSAPGDGWIATVPIGYADGVPRALTGQGVALIDGRAHSFAGTVCMDQILVWCGDFEPRIGDEVVLLGNQGDATISVDDWAGAVGTISYEIATSIGARVPRVAA